MARSVLLSALGIISGFLPLPVSASEDKVQCPRRGSKGPRDSPACMSWSSKELPTSLVVSEKTPFWPGTTDCAYGHERTNGDCRECGACKCVTRDRAVARLGQGSRNNANLLVGMAPAALFLCLVAGAVAGYRCRVERKLKEEMLTVGDSVAPPPLDSADDPFLLAALKCCGKWPAGQPADRKTVMRWELFVIFLSLIPLSISLANVAEMTDAGEAQPYWTGCRVHEDAGADRSARGGMAASFEEDYEKDGGPWTPRWVFLLMLVPAAIYIVTRVVVPHGVWMRGFWAVMGPVLRVSGAGGRADGEKVVLPSHPPVPAPVGKPDGKKVYWRSL